MRGTMKKEKESCHPQRSQPSRLMQIYSQHQFVHLHWGGGGSMALPREGSMVIINWHSQLIMVLGTIRWGGPMVTAWWGLLVFDERPPVERSLVLGTGRWGGPMVIAWRGLLVFDERPLVERSMVLGGLSVTTIRVSVVTAVFFLVLIPLRAHLRAFFYYSLTRKYLHNSPNCKSKYRHNNYYSSYLITTYTDIIST